MVRKAFTMLELVMVIVVLGIVASIGADIIANLYENYLKTRSQERLQSQTEAVLDQIAKRLQYRIKDSVIARESANFNNYEPLPQVSPGDDYQIIEWIGKANEAFLGEHNGTSVVPGWSGFIDLDDANTSQTNGTLRTRGSRLDFASNIINALSYGQVDLNGTNALQRPALIFKGKDSFNIDNYGWNSNDGNYTHRVTMASNDIFNLIEANATRPTEIYEQYDLAWSAYALVPVGNANDFNLTLHYNYQPWEDEDYRDVNGTVLMEHVSTFRFTQIGETIRLKLCINDANQSGDYNFGFCKEKVVF